VFIQTSGTFTALYCGIGLQANVASVGFCWLLWRSTNLHIIIIIIIIIITGIIIMIIR